MLESLRRARPSREAFAVIDIIEPSPSVARHRLWSAHDGLFHYAEHTAERSGFFTYC